MSRAAPRRGTVWNDPDLTWSDLVLTRRRSIVTPIKVSHSLIYEIYFSVWGETDKGEPMSKPGPGGLRFMKVQRPIAVPSVSRPDHWLE